MKIKKYLSAIAIALFTVNHSYAATVDFNDLPQSIINNQLAAEAADGAFLLGGKDLAARGSFNSFLDTPSFSVFDLTGFANPETTFTDSFLIRYNLDSSSKIEYTNATGNTINQPLTGNAWVAANKFLSLDDKNIFSVYRDKVESLNGLNEESLRFSLTNAAAITGSGSVSQPDAFSAPPTQSGSMRVDEVTSCIECGFDITLNLIGLGYDVTGQSFFNLSDNRTSLMTFRDYLNGGLNNNNFNKTETLNVQPVPLPSSMGMFLSAFLVLFFRVKRFNSIFTKFNFKK
jgi:hypothetical protein